MFIVEHSVEIKLEETSVPTAHNIASKLEDLQMQFEYGRTAGADNWHPHTTELLWQLSEEDRLSCTELFQSAMAAGSIKLQTVPEKHPCIHLFKLLSISSCSRSSPGGRRKKGH